MASFRFRPAAVVARFSCLIRRFSRMDFPDFFWGCLAISLLLTGEISSRELNYSVRSEGGAPVSMAHQVRRRELNQKKLKRGV